MRWHLYGRTTYVDALTHLGDVEHDADGAAPTLDDVDVSSGDDAEWVELVAMPADEVVWILRDGELVRELAGAALDDGGAA